MPSYWLGTGNLDKVFSKIVDVILADQNTCITDVHNVRLKNSHGEYT